jgi:phosphoribosylamine--glycine ligase
VRVLVIGSGAREHALCVALSSDPAVSGLACAPGNAGTRAVAEPLAVDVADPDAVAAVATAWRADLVVIGPEVPLVAGAADAVRDAGIPCFGPSAQAAQLEGSKSFAKHVMTAAGVPTARAWPVGGPAELETVLDEVGAPYVVKDDGLAAGKGVLVTDDREAALAHASHYLQQGPVLVEEFLDGQEVSLFLLSDGSNVLPLSPAQDYKRLRDGDAGPNTGGMGAYSPLPWLDERFGSEQAFVDEVIETVALPTIRRLDEEQTPFIGLLYAGLIITSRGIRVIEFNARFGDPETQVVLPRLTTPLSGLLYAAATGRLAEQPRPEFRPDAAVTVVLASEGYPESPETGRRIDGLEAAASVPGVHIAHAATAVGSTADDAEPHLIATGGRVLNVVAVGDGFAEARRRAYEALGHLRLEGGQYRTDIAARVAD